MMMNLIAELSKGGTLPDGKIIGMPQRVIYQCSEDGVSDTIKPRLEKCGADCRNVAFINEETYSGLTLDDERIRQAIIEFRPRLVVIDPIQAYLGSDSDLQIAGRARKLMQRLGMWASVYDCAIVLIGHLNKKEGTKGLYRSLGSIDVVAAARSVLQVERDPKDADIRIVRQIKNSLAPSDGEIRFSITAEDGFRWLWYPFIAVGKITLLQGDPGDGKSTMMMNLIAELSKGGKLPDGKAVGLSQRVIYQCSEDGVSDTIKPRLEKCGADCGNVAFINEETYSGLTLDDERIRQAIIEFRPKLVVIDPIQAYLGSDSDLQIAGRARKLMQRLGMWASVYDCAIVLIGHLNKKEGTKGLYRSLGSIDVVAAARSVLQVERDPKNTDVRIVRQIKNSLAPSDGEIKFSITAEQGFQWLECEIAQDPAAEPETPVFESKSEKAAYLIKKLLSEDDMRSREIYMRLSDEGISRRTAENTKKELGIRSYRKMRQWYWSIKPGE